MTGVPPAAVDRLLEESRRRIAPRVEPADLEAVMAAGALVVDTRPVEQRRRDGELPGAVVVDRNVLEWRLDPTCPHRLPGADRPERQVVVVCNEGYSSSLAAATLRGLGLPNATDLAGGFQAWCRRPRRAEVDAGGRRVAYARAGAGPPVVLLHGGMDDSRSWRWQLEGLAADCTVLAWDAPGCGRSPDPPEGWRLPDYADCAAAWLEAAGVGSAHVVGLSWGSSLALELYRRHPRLFRSLVLVSAYAGWAGSLPPGEVAARLEGALATADLPPADLLAGWPGMLSAAAPPALVAELEAVWADNAGVHHPAGFRAMVRSMAEADLRDVLPAVAVPTLVVHGEADTRSPLAVARQLAGAVPGARLEVLPGAGHLCNAEVPAAFDACVRAWVRRLEG